MKRIDRLVRQALGAWLLAGAAAVGAAGASNNGVAVSVPNGFVTLDAQDMALQTVAGEFNWVRSWDGQEWKFNPHWESLSQSWKNLTGSQTADTTGSTFTLASALSGLATASSTGSDCWVWVDEEGPLLAGTGAADAGPMVAARSTPFNHTIGEPGAADYPTPRRVTVDFASLCVGSSINGGSTVREAEGIRRLAELYLGDDGRYGFNNRTVLEKRTVRQLPANTAATPYAGLDTGQITLAPQTNAKGWRWIERSGDWIDYNTQGQVVAYGDRNDNTIWLVRDSAGMLRGVVDAVGRVLITLHYTGSLVTEIRDYPVAGLAGDLPARSVKYQYDSLNRLTKVTDVRGSETQYAYDTANRIVKITDANGNSELLAYNGPSVSKHTAADGAVTDYVFEFDDVNKQFVSKIIGPETEAGRRVEDLTHSRVGKLVRRMVNGRVDQEVKLDPAARTQASADVRGSVTLTTRNEFEQVTKIVEPGGAVSSRRYSALHLGLIESIDPLGVKNQYDYDSKGNLLKARLAVGTPEERVTEYVLNSLGQTTQITDKGRVEVNGTVTRDATWQLEYDTLGQVRKVTEPEGGVREYRYNRSGQMISKTDPRGYATQYEVDAAGNLVKETDALGQAISLNYDKLGNATTYTNARGKSIRSAFDAMNRRTQTTNAVGGVSKTQYNGQGQQVQRTDEDGRFRRSRYDNFLREVETTDALGNTTQMGYLDLDAPITDTVGLLSKASEVRYPTYLRQTHLDQLGRPNRQITKHRNKRGDEEVTRTMVYDQKDRVISETDAYGRSRTALYDALGQLTQSTNALGAKTNYRYNAWGSVLQVIDANGGVYSFEYDRNSRLVKQTLPLGQISQYSYDASGNLVLMIDAAGQQFKQTYDAINQLTEASQLAADGTVLRSSTFTWDATGNLTGWSDTDHTRPAGQQTTSATNSYDDASRKTGERITYPTPDGKGYVLSYGQAHSLAGKKTQLTWPDGTAIGYGYSLHGELESVDIPGEGTITVNQFRWTAPEKITLPGGTTRSMGYDGFLTLEELSVKTPGQSAVLEVKNEFGKEGEVTSRAQAGNTVGSSSTFSQAYTYDAETRLTAVSGDRSESFTLDALGNRLVHSQQAGEWRYDANNRLIQRGNGACGSTGAVCYDYDARGNQIRKTEGSQVTQYVFDALNQLVEVRDGLEQPISRYGYDPMGRRIWKEQYRSRHGAVLSPARRTYFLYADEGLIAEATQAVHMQADGSVTAESEPAIATQYGPKPGNAFGTGMLFIKTTDSRGRVVFAYYHVNEQETPIQATDGAGRVVWSAEYSAFGEARIGLEDPAAEYGRIQSNLRLPGQYEDLETGLYYNHYRFYDPLTGRYVQSDPIGLSGGANFYAYVGASPTTGVDPYGLFDPNPDPNRPIDIPDTSKPIPGKPKPRVPKPPMKGPGRGLGWGLLISIILDEIINKDEHCADDPRGKVRPWCKKPPDDDSCILYYIRDCNLKIVYVGISKAYRAPQREWEHYNDPNGKIRQYECPTCKMEWREEKRYATTKECKEAEKNDIKLLLPFINKLENPERGLVAYKKYLEWYMKNCVPCQ